jgi:hypothetical protein
VRSKYIESIKFKIYDYVVANYTKVDGFVLGDIPYNFRCHLNSVQKVREGKAQKVYACIAIKKSDWKDIIVHFINQLEDGTYQDNTWGWTHDEYNYYLVKEIPESEFNHIGDVLQGLQISLIKANSSAFLRKLLRIKLDFI